MQTIVSLDNLCKFLDLTPQRVNQLVNEGVIPRKERGKYELLVCVKSYIAYLRLGNTSRDQQSTDYSMHRMRLTRAKADIMEMEKAQLEEQLIPVADIERAWLDVAANMRAKMLALPTKVSAEVFAAKSLAEVKDVLKHQINESLEELSNVEVHVTEPLRSSESEADSDQDVTKSEAAA